MEVKILCFNNEIIINKIIEKNPNCSDKHMSNLHIDNFINGVIWTEFNNTLTFNKIHYYTLSTFAPKVANSVCSAKIPYARKTVYKFIIIKTK